MTRDNGNAHGHRSSRNLSLFVGSRKRVACEVQKAHAVMSKLTCVFFYSATNSESTCLRNRRGGIWLRQSLLELLELSRRRRRSAGGECVMILLGMHTSSIRTICSRDESSTLSCVRNICNKRMNKLTQNSYKYNLALRELNNH